MCHVISPSPLPSLVCTYSLTPLSQEYARQQGLSTSLDEPENCHNSDQPTTKDCYPSSGSSKHGMFGVGEVFFPSEVLHVWLHSWYHSVQLPRASTQSVTLKTPFGTAGDQQGRQKISVCPRFVPHVVSGCVRSVYRSVPAKSFMRLWRLRRHNKLRRSGRLRRLGG